MTNVDELEKRIAEWHQTLNSEGTIPPGLYRRNTSEYQLICYINNVIGCFIAGNHSTASLFLYRARQHIERCPANSNLEGFYQEASAYLSDVESYLRLSDPGALLEHAKFYSVE